MRCWKHLAKANRGDPNLLQGEKKSIFYIQTTERDEYYDEIFLKIKHKTHGFCAVPCLKPSD
jgi:hypothetical protein